MGAKGNGEIGDNQKNGEEEMRDRISHIAYRISLKKILLILTAGFLFYTASGCGYTTRSMISNKYKNIYITPFINKIDITNETDTGNRYRLYYPHLETDVTRKVINRFLFDGNLKPFRQSSADLILKGEVVQFRKDPVRYDDADNVTEYRISIQVNIVLWDTKEKKMLWQENNFTGEQSYFVTGTLAKSEGTAVKEALDDLARRIVERAVEEW